MKISVLIPVYNEVHTLEEILRRVFEIEYDMEIILIDDYSTDGTRVLYPGLKEKYGDALQVLYHDKNQGKGAAIRTGLEQVKGDIVLIQDADLEYDPQDYYKIVKPILRNRANVVYGSRFTGEHSNMFFHHIRFSKKIRTKTTIPIFLVLQLNFFIIFSYLYMLL